MSQFIIFVDKGIKISIFFIIQVFVAGLQPVDKYLFHNYNNVDFRFSNNREIISYYL